MVKRVKTPEVNEEAKYYTCWKPYPHNADFELSQDYIKFCRWIANILGDPSPLYAVYYKPKANGMVIFAVDKTYPRPERLLGEHRWMDILKKPAKGENELVSKIFYCTYNTDREVQKDGWKCIFVEDYFFLNWGMDKWFTKVPYPAPQWCTVPPENKVEKALCRPLPGSQVPRPAELSTPPPRPVVGSADWAQTRQEQVRTPTGPNGRGRGRAVASERGRHQAQLTWDPDSFPALDAKPGDPKKPIPGLTLPQTSVAMSAWESRPSEPQRPFTKNPLSPRTPLSPPPSSPGLTLPKTSVAISSWESRPSEQQRPFSKNPSSSRSPLSPPPNSTAHLVWGKGPPSGSRPAAPSPTSSKAAPSRAAAPSPPAATSPASSTPTAANAKAAKASSFAKVTSPFPPPSSPAAAPSPNATSAAANAKPTKASSFAKVTSPLPGASSGAASAGPKTPSTNAQQNKPQVGQKKIPAAPQPQPPRQPPARNAKSSPQPTPPNGKSRRMSSGSSSAGSSTASAVSSAPSSPSLAPMPSFSPSGAPVLGQIDVTDYDCDDDYDELITEETYHHEVWETASICEPPKSAPTVRIGGSTGKGKETTAKARVHSWAKNVESSKPTNLWVEPAKQPEPTNTRAEPAKKPESTNTRAEPAKKPEPTNLWAEPEKKPEPVPNLWTTAKPLIRPTGSVSATEARALENDDVLCPLHKGKCPRGICEEYKRAKRMKREKNKKKERQENKKLKKEEKQEDDGDETDTPRKSESAKPKVAQAERPAATLPATSLGLKKTWADDDPDDANSDIGDVPDFSTKTGAPSSSPDSLNGPGPSEIGGSRSTGSPREEDEESYNGDRLSEISGPSYGGGKKYYQDRDYQESYNGDDLSEVGGHSPRGSTMGRDDEGYQESFNGDEPDFSEYGGTGGRKYYDDEDYED